MKLDPDYLDRVRDDLHLSLMLMARPSMASTELVERCVTAQHRVLAAHAPALLEAIREAYDEQAGGTADPGPASIPSVSPATSHTDGPVRPPEVSGSEGVGEDESPAPSTFTSTESER